MIRSRGLTIEGIARMKRGWWKMWTGIRGGRRRVQRQRGLRGWEAEGGLHCLDGGRMVQAREELDRWGVMVVVLRRLDQVQDLLCFDLLG